MTGRGPDDVDLSDLGPDVGPLARRAERRLRLIEATRRREREAAAVDRPEASDGARPVELPSVEPRPVEPPPDLAPALGAQLDELRDALTSGVEGAHGIDGPAAQDVLRRLEEAADRLRRTTPRNDG